MTSLVAVSPLACSSGVDSGAADEPVAGPAHAAAIAQAKLDYGEAMVECLRGYGLAVSVDDDGRGIEGIRPPGLTADEYLAHFERCEEELVATGRIEPPATASREYFEGAYDYQLTLKACLETEGYTVSEPPTKESYVESQGENWVPYDAVVTNSLAEWERINRLCPQDYRPY